jgi:hypothetical protein
MLIDEMPTAMPTDPPWAKGDCAAGLTAARFLSSFA